LLQDAHDIRGIDTVGQDDRACRRAKCGDFLHRHDGRCAGGCKAEQQNVGLVVPDKRDRARPVSGLAHDDESWFSFEESAQAVPEDGMLSGDGDANGVAGRTSHVSRQR
jgi:hypothetical protein